MKRLLLVSLCLTGFMANAMQQQEQRSPLRQQLDAERKAFLQLQQPLLGDAAAASASDARLVTVESMAVAGGGASPARPVVAAQTVSPDDAFQDVLSESDIQDLFRREPALKKLTEAQQELFASKFQQIMTVVREMLEADKDQDEARKLSKKQRIAASAIELGIFTPGMMVYSFFLDRGGYNTAAVVQHLVAGSWVRNTKQVNPLLKVVLAFVAVGAAQGLDYHVAIPYLGYALGLAPLTLFYALRVIQAEIAKGNPIQATKDTFYNSARRFGGWVKSVVRRNHPTTSDSAV